MKQAVRRMVRKQKVPLTSENEDCLGPCSRPAGGTFQVSKHIGSYPRVRIEGDGRAVVSQAGGVLLVETIRKAWLDRAISGALWPWRRPSGGARSGQDPAGRGPRGRTRRGLPGQRGHTASRVGGIGRLVGRRGPEDGVDNGAGTTADQGQEPQRLDKQHSAPETKHDLMQQGQFPGNASDRSLRRNRRRPGQRRRGLWDGR
jgi:hypothetical protein